MEPDTITRELWESKDGRLRRFGGDVRALCRYLMELQESRECASPLVLDLAASRKTHEERIAQLPPPVPGEELLPDDPIMTELRAVRTTLQLERECHPSVLREEPPEYGQKKD